MKEERKYYVDNIRWACILLLVPFHSAMTWNCWGEESYIWFSSNKILSTFIILLSPWYMPILFVMAGMSARYSLNRRTYSQFMMERVKKLLIPLVTGILTVVAVMTFYADKFHNGYSGNFFEHYKVFHTTFTDLTGYDGGWTPAHLWFMLYLFLVSCICLGVIALQRKYFKKLDLSNMNMGLVAACGLFPVMLTRVLDFGGKSIGSYFALFLLGFYVISEDNILDKLHKYRYVSLAIMIVADILDVYMFIWMDDANSTLNTIAMVITRWAGILAILGLAKNSFNQHNKVTTYLSRHSFVFYIFHFMWLVIFQYYLSKRTSNTVVLYVIPVIGTYIMNFITIEIVTRIPIVNRLYGAKK